MSIILSSTAASGGAVGTAEMTLNAAQTIGVGFSRSAGAGSISPDLPIGANPKLIDNILTFASSPPLVVISLQHSFPGELLIDQWTRIIITGTFVGGVNTLDLLSDNALFNPDGANSTLWTFDGTPAGVTFIVGNAYNVNWEWVA